MGLLRASLLVLCLVACGGTRLPPMVVEARSPAIGTGARLTQDVGLELSSGGLALVLPRGCKVPCSRTFTAQTQVDGQRRISLRLVRGPVLAPGHTESIGKVDLLGIPPAPKGRTIEVTLRAAKRHLSLEARDPDTGSPLEIRVVLLE